MKNAIIALCLVISGQLYANDYQPLFDSCLSLKTSTTANAAQPCRFFIKGFMAASALTGVPLDSTLNKDKSDFFQRAYDSRLGKTSLEQRQAQCEVPKNQDLIINEVSKSIPEKFENLTQLKLIIINALKNNQYCSNEKS